MRNKLCVGKMLAEALSNSFFYFFLLYTSKYARALQRDRITLYIVMKYTLIYLELEKKSYSHETGGSKLIVSV
jgi:hypothetical protein